MLTSSDIFDAIDSSSERIASDHPELSTHIALLGIHLKEIVTTVSGENGKMTHISELFDLCHAIDDDAEWRPRNEIRKEILLHRTAAMNAMITTYYSEEKMLRQEEREHLRDEEGVAGLLAASLPSLRNDLPPHLGPAWLKDHASDVLWEAAETYAYDLQSDTYDWKRFAALLPKDLQKRFDITDTPIDVIDITSMEQVKEILALLSERTGIPMSDFGDVEKVGRLSKQYPILEEVLEFCKTSTEIPSAPVHELG